MSNSADLIKRFLAYLRAERGAGESTTGSYEHDIREFVAFVEKPLPQATRLDVQRYMAECLSRGLSARTAARRLACLRHFYRFLIDEEETQKEPTRNLPIPKRWKTVPKLLSQADLDKMVASLGSSWIEVRDRAMLLTFYGSGLRASELAALKMQDLDLDAGAAKVWNGKGGKDGLVPLSPPAIAALKHYLETVRPKFADRAGSPHVFLTRSGHPLTRVEVFYRVRNVAKSALGKRISPHFLRHGFATALVEGGADIRDVQILMRHSSVDTTAIYIHIDLKYLRRWFYASHPRARIVKAAN